MPKIENGDVKPEDIKIGHGVPKRKPIVEGTTKAVWAFDDMEEIRKAGKSIFYGKLEIDRMYDLHDGHYGLFYKTGLGAKIRADQKLEVK